MQNHNSLKKEFIKKWTKGLEICSSSKEKMGLMERKKAIKLSSDLALASSRIGKRTWSHALISKATNDGETENLAKQILGVDDDDHHKNPNQLNNAAINKHNKTRKIFIGRSSSNTEKKKKKKKKKCINIVPRKTCKFRSRNEKMRKARSMAKRLVKKRTQILKELVPGGEYMDDYCFFKETLDYVVSLQAQVDVMHHLANSPLLFFSS